MIKKDFICYKVTIGTPNFAYKTISYEILYLCKIMSMIMSMVFISMFARYNIEFQISYISFGEDW